MDYHKPEIMNVCSALVVVQGGMKGTNQSYDSLMVQTIGAYEADE